MPCTQLHMAIKRKTWKKWKTWDKKEKNTNFRFSPWNVKFSRKMRCVVTEVVENLQVMCSNEHFACAGQKCTWTHKKQPDRREQRIRITTTVLSICDSLTFSQKRVVQLYCQSMFNACLRAALAPCRWTVAWFDTAWTPNASWASCDVNVSNKRWHPSHPQPWKPRQTSLLCSKMRWTCFSRCETKTALHSAHSNNLVTQTRADKHRFKSGWNWCMHLCTLGMPSCVAGMFCNCNWK